MDATRDSGKIAYIGGCLGPAENYDRLMMIIINFGGAGLILLVDVVVLFLGSSVVQTPPETAA